MNDKCPGMGCPLREYCKRHDPDGKMEPLFDQLNLTCEMHDPDIMKEWGNPKNTPFLLMK